VEAEDHRQAGGVHEPQPAEIDDDSAVLGGDRFERVGEAGGVREVQLAAEDEQRQPVGLGGRQREGRAVAHGGR
jgi:hypothetical protein